MVVHLLVEPDAGPEAGVGAVAGGAPSQVGLVVSKAVGNAVHRNRVKRRLRHIAAAHLRSVPAGALMVVRALPASGSATYAELDQDLVRCLDRAVSRARRAT